MLLLAPPSHAEAVNRWHAFVDEASTRFGLPASWIARVIRAESAGQTVLKGQPIRSKAGAIGLMQLMPATWLAMRTRLGLADTPDDPRSNILAGTLFLRLLYDRFGYPGLFAAYNAGPERYDAFLAGGRPLPMETIGYLTKVSGAAEPRFSGAIMPGRQTLFVMRKGDFVDLPKASSDPTSGPLFVIGGGAVMMDRRAGARALGWGRGAIWAGGSGGSGGEGKQDKGTVSRHCLNYCLHIVFSGDTPRTVGGLGGVGDSASLLRDRRGRSLANGGRPS